jgi:uncharacterized membrane protein YkoI
VCIRDAQVGVPHHPGWVLIAPAGGESSGKANDGSLDPAAIQKGTTMDRSQLTSRRVIVGATLAVALGTGVGLGAISLFSTATATTPQSYRVDTSGFPSTGSQAADGPTTPTTAPAPADAPANAPADAPAPAAVDVSDGVSMEEAATIAVQFAPGQVYEVDQDRDFLSGLQYEVTIRHDNGTSTEVDIDADTGQIVSTDFDNDWD